MKVIDWGGDGERLRKASAKKVIFKLCHQLEKLGEEVGKGVREEKM